MLAFLAFLCYLIISINKEAIEKSGHAHSSRFVKEQWEMNKKQIKSFVEESLALFLEEKGLELYDVDFVKEGKDYFLRVYIDKKQEGEEELYIGTEDCESVSRYLSLQLDEKDPIEQNYYLEVASAGMDRELKKDEHFRRYTGRSVDLKLYQNLEGKKTISGKLLEKKESSLILEKDGNEIEILLKDIAKVSLTVVL